MTLGLKTAEALKSEPFEVRFVPTVTTMILAYAAEVAAANCAAARRQHAPCATTTTRRTAVMIVEVRIVRARATDGTGAGGRGLEGRGRKKTGCQLIPARAFEPLHTPWAFRIFPPSPVISLRSHRRHTRSSIILSSFSSSPSARAVAAGEQATQE